MTGGSTTCCARMPNCRSVVAMFQSVDRVWPVLPLVRQEELRAARMTRRDERLGFYERG